MISRNDFLNKILNFNVFKKNSLNPGHVSAVVSFTKGTIPVQSVHLHQKPSHVIGKVELIWTMLNFLSYVIFTYGVFEVVFNRLILWIACVI